jgi:hypothetical protein
MDQNPYESPREANPRSTLAITIGRIAAVVLWVLAALRIVNGVLVALLVPGASEFMKSDPAIFAMFFASRYLLPSSGIALLGLAAWRRKVIFAALGIVLVILGVGLPHIIGAFM